MKIILILFFGASTFIMDAQNKLGIQIRTGRVIAYSELIPTENYTPNFHTFTEQGGAYDIHIKYYLKNRFSLSTGISYYNRMMSIGLYLSDRETYVNESSVGFTNNLFSLLAGYYILDTKNEKWSIDIFGGLQFEHRHGNLPNLGGFPGLVKIENTPYIGWHTLLHGGIGADFHFRKSNIGVDFIGSLGFRPSVDIRYRAYYTSNGEVYEGIHRFKGSYIGLFLSYEWGWNFKKKEIE